MKKEPKIFLQHIVESIQAIESYIKEMSKEKFLEDGKTQDAVIRKIEIIGEAVKNLPLTFRKKYSDINWRETAGMRDVVIHEYFGVDLNIVWKTATKELPNFKERVLKILDELNGQNTLSLKSD